MKIDLIAGARPNFVKIAALIHANQDLGTPLELRLIHTGQHYDEALSGSFFEQLKIPAPDINLGVGSGSQAEQTAAIMLAYEKILQENRPKLCIVVGDVTSSMACAITAKKMGVDVAHVEAGIRSGDLSMPEEVNRILIDSIADYFFTTTSKASTHLKNSGIPAEKIFFVGNTMIDTLMRFRSHFKKPQVWDDLRLETGKFLMLTLHRPGNVDEVKHLINTLKQILDNCRDFPVIFPVHPRTEKILRDHTFDHKNFHPVKPLSYLEFNYLIERSKAVLTDSGGITEETTVLGIPCMTLRDSTERPETITIGTNELLGTDPSAIASALEKLFTANWKKGTIPELWDGKAGNRISSILSRIYSSF